ncbi:MAG: glutamine synthetase [Gammaproteobacteria bacterium]|nr:MAG: glutamine synthetase [Gammaproteobacteria bacterium]
MMAPESPGTPTAQSGDAEFVLLGMPDVHGSIRGKALRPAAFQSALDNGTVMTDLWLGLDPVDAPITDYEHFGIRSGAADLLLVPDSETLRELAWRPGWRICLATPSWPDGSCCDLASREVLRAVLTAMAALGYEVLAAFEYEVRIWDRDAEPLSSGLSYHLNEIGRFSALLSSLVPALDGLGIELEAVHTEAGPGLLELNIAARPGLRAADDAAFVKFAVKDVATSLGLRASFLAKTMPLEEGSSGHVHLSLWRDGTNAFAPANPDDGAPPVSAAAIAGLLEHLPAASLLLNPTVNSYKRLVPGFFAPVNVSWGYQNRSASIRAIHSARSEHSRLECRRPGADANPYLALAALVASAGDGIRHESVPPAPLAGDVAERADLVALPNSLESALDAFRSDEVLRAALGEEFSKYYAISRAWELRAWQKAVSDWERERYLRTV